MSSFKERKEKVCLNCNAVVYGRYCHLCGQENIETKETFFQLAAHFIGDLLHFEGRFFSTVGYLLRRPGFLSDEYKRGRRAAYINPIRLYLFTSAFFFFIMFALTDDNERTNLNVANQSLIHKKKRIESELTTLKDSALLHLKKDTLRAIQVELDFYENGLIFDDADSANHHSSREWPIYIKADFPRSIEEYEAQQAKLNAAQKDNFLMTFAMRKIIQINLKYKNQNKLFKEKVGDKFLHSLPMMMFIAMPFIALFLSLLYARNKTFYYADHAILTLHVFTALYLIIILAVLFGKLNELTNLSIFSILSIFMSLYIVYYGYQSIKQFYQQTSIKSLIKFVILGCWTIVVFVCLSVIFLINSLINA